MNDPLRTEQRLHFKGPNECVIHFVQKANSMSYGYGERPDQKQHICTRCRRWKYDDERCNLFIDGGRPRA